MIQELGDLNPLSTLPNLKVLSLLDNPVTKKQHYRKYVIFKIKPLKVLDFQKVKLKVSLSYVINIGLFFTKNFTLIDLYVIVGTRRS